MALKILLADDNITAQRLGAKILADGGHNVITVSNGAAAVKKIAAEHPDLLILDVYMPGYSGLEVCTRVKGAPETAKVPVLLSVTSMEPFSPEEGNRAKADGVMVKPFIASDLLAVVEKFERKLNAAAPPPPAPSIQEFHDASYEEWKAEAAPEEEPQAARMEVSQEMAASPVLGMDEMPVAPAPAFGVDTAEFQVPAPAAFDVKPEPFEAQPAFEVAAQATPAMAAVELSPEPLLEVSQSEPAPADIGVEMRAGPAPEVEFTAAPRVGAIEVTPAPELEPTIQPSAEEPVIAQDPALVTTPEEMAQFTTSFGEEHPEDISVGTAMPEPAAEAPLELASENVVAISAEPATDFEIETEPPTPQPVAEMGLDTVRLEPPPELQTERALEPPAAAPEPEPHYEAETQTEPVTESAIAAAEIEIPPEPELPRPFTVGAYAAAAALAREPQLAIPPAVTERAVPHDDLVARFAAELEQAAQAHHEQVQPEAPPEFEAEPPAAAALPASPGFDEEHLVGAVSAVVDRYLDGVKREMIAAIVRELKK